MSRKPPTDHTQYECFLWDAVEAPPATERLQPLAESICANYKATQPYPCKAEFYPYVGLSSTIRIRNGKTYIRLSDILEDAPTEVLAALIRILIAQLSRNKPRPADLETYKHHMHSPEVEARHHEVRVQRSKKPEHNPEGRFHHLQASFDRVNAQYFSPPIEMPTLRWSQKKSRFRLGYHDSLHNQIVISRWLDRKSVPVYVLDYVMYHEMLHIVIPPVRRNHKRIVHPPAFQAQEKRFAQYDRAIHWLEGSGLSVSGLLSAIESFTKDRLS